MVTVNPYIFRSYDIRGEVSKELNSGTVAAIGKAYGTFLQKRQIRHAVIGHDSRGTGPEFRDIFVKSLTETGINVIDIGITLSPIMYYAQYKFQTNGGVIVTASHNPSNYNGFKLANGYSSTTEKAEIQEIKALTESEDFFISQEKGTVEKVDVKEDYYQDLLKRVRIKKKFKIVVDSGCGTTGIFLPEILRRIGCEVIEQHTKLDSNFPFGTPDPTDEKTMVRVKQRVLKEKADLGFAFDGDGDRIGCVDENGNIIWNDILVAIFAEGILERFPEAPIIFNGLCSQLVTKVILKNNGKPIMWRTGYSFIKSKIAQEKAPFGGEISGHFFFADNHYGHDDAAFAMLRLLEILSNKDCTLFELTSKFPKFISSPEVKIGCGDDVKVEVIKKLGRKFREDFPGLPVSDDTTIPGDDGVRIDFEDGMIIFRYSQNGPYLTIRYEAMDQETYEKRKEYIRSMLENYEEIELTGKQCVNMHAL